MPSNLFIEPVVNKALVDVFEDEKTRAAEIAAALYGSEIPGTDDDIWEYIRSSLYPFDEWYADGKKYEVELKQEYGNLEYDELVTKDLNKQIRNGVIKLIVLNGKIWVFLRG